MRNCSILFAGLALFAVLTWQWATVRANYAANWTALFCTGAVRGVPPTLASEHIYLFPGSTGFDGQMYHYIAHDPLMRSQELKRYVDEPRMRYRRILLPALAWLLALGRAGWIDGMYLAVNLLFVGLGVFWSAELLRGIGRHPAWGLLFLLLPATVVSVDRLVTDGALAALAVAFVLHAKRPCWQLFLVLAAATLTRETGFLLLAGYCGYLSIQRRWATAAVFSLAGLPAALWYGYVQLHSAPLHYAPHWLPLPELLGSLLHPVLYPAGVPLVPLVQAADLLALAGMLLAFALAILLVARGCLQPECLAALLFALVGIFVLPQRTDEWQNVYGFGRAWSPLLLFLAVEALRRRSVAWLLPWALMVPRLAIQIAPQALGAIKALAAHPR
ncbi:MAG: hypothetical protein ABSF98_10240 [Bryobacteraceae bacterium]|jgi:hypothetical protein